MFKMTFSSPLPLGLSRLLWETRAVFFRIFNRIFPLALALTLCVSLPDWIIRGITGATHPVTQEAASSLTVSGLFLALLGFLISSFLGPFLFDQVAALYEGQARSVSDSAHRVYTRFFALLMGMVLASVLVVCGLILCVFPGIFLFIVWSLYIPLCLFENKPPLEALYFSWKWIRVARAWWQTAFLIFLPAGVILYINAVLYALLHDYWPLDVLAQCISSTLLMVFLTCAISVQYTHLKQYYPLAEEKRAREKAAKQNKQAGHTEEAA